MRRSSVLTTLMVLLLLAGAEVGARTAWGLTPPAASWPHPEMAVKAEQLNAIGLGADRVDVLFAGSSVVAQNIDADVFTRLSNLEAYNAGLSGAPLRTTSAFVRDVALRSISPPSAVVVGTTTWELNDRGSFNHEFHTKFVESTAYGRIPRNLADEAERWLVEHSAIFANRHRLRTDGAADALPDRAAAPPTAEPPPYSSRGTRLGEVPDEYEVSEAFAERHGDEVLVDYSVGGHEVGALLALADVVERTGGRLIVIAMPMTEDYIPLHPAGLGDVASFEAQLRRIAAEPGITVIDARSVVPAPKTFFDPLHLTGPGREEFTRAIAAAWPPPDCSDLMRLDVVGALRCEEGASGGGG